MKKVGEPKPNEAVEEESVQVGLVEWRRSWGRPSTVVLIGTLLFTLPMPLALLGAGCGCLFALLSEPGEFWIKFAGAVSLIPLGAYTLPWALRFYRYYQSFSWDEESQRRFDKSLVLVRKSSASFPLRSQQHHQLIGESLANLRSSYQVRLASREERRILAAFLRKSSPDSFPVFKPVHVYFVSDGNDRSCLWIVMESGQGATNYDGMFQGAVVKLDAEVGTMLLRRQAVADSIVELFTPIKMKFPDSPAFCRAYFVEGDSLTARPENLPLSFREALTTAQDIVVRTENTLAMIVDSTEFIPDRVLPVVDIALSALCKKAPATPSAVGSWAEGDGQ